MFNEHILIQMFLFYFMFCSLFLGAGCNKCWSKKTITVTALPTLREAGQKKRAYSARLTYSIE